MSSGVFELTRQETYSSKDGKQTASYETLHEFLVGDTFKNTFYERWMSEVSDEHTARTDVVEAFDQAVKNTTLAFAVAKDDFKLGIKPQIREITIRNAAEYSAYGRILNHFYKTIIPIE